MPTPRSNFSYAKSGSSDKGTDYSSVAFLVVDDEEGIKDLVADALRTCRARNVYQAANGEEALGKLMAVGSHIDVVISDFNMQPVHGLQLLKKIRSGELKDVAPDLPVILLTGHADQPVVQKALELKVTGFLTKPVSLEKLISAVNKALKK